MPENIRALIVILPLAVLTFYIGRQIASSIVSDREFAVWRNVWFAVTVVAFLSLNYIIYAIMLVGVCVYARKLRWASVALYIVLLLVLPLGNVEAKGAGIFNYLLTLNNGRLLAIVFLLPILFATRGFERRHVSAYATPDRLVVGYMLLLTALEFRNPEFSITNLMRQVTLYALDMLIPYFAFSRTVTGIADVRKVFLAFVIAVLPLALITLFETVKGWHLYSVVAYSWGGGAGYLQRDGMERGFASAFGSISMGFVIMVAIGCMLGIWQTIRYPFKGIVFVIFAVGLFATLSRGPWVGVAILLLLYVAMGTTAFADLGKVAAIGAVGLALLMVTPFGPRLTDLVPFSSVDKENVIYRQKLFDNAIVVVQRYPLFGTAEFRQTPEMREMEQGQHIIDIVNTYLEIAMRSGLVGLSLFFGIFATILLGLRRTLKFRAIKDAELKNFVRASIATLIAILVTIATVSSVDFIPFVYWSFAGLGVALIRIGYQERFVAMRAVSASGIPV